MHLKRVTGILLRRKLRLALCFGKRIHLIIYRIRPLPIGFYRRAVRYLANEVIARVTQAVVRIVKIFLSLFLKLVKGLKLKLSVSAVVRLYNTYRIFICIGHHCAVKRNVVTGVICLLNRVRILQDSVYKRVASVFVLGCAVFAVDFCSIVFVYTRRHINELYGNLRFG